MRLKTTVSSKGRKKESKNVLILFIKTDFLLCSSLLFLPLANIHSLNPGICECVILNGKGTLQMQLSQGSWEGRLSWIIWWIQCNHKGPSKKEAEGAAWRRTCYAGSRRRRDMTVGFEDGRGPLSKASGWPPGTQPCWHLHSALWDPFWTSDLTAYKICDALSC